MKSQSLLHLLLSLLAVSLLATGCAENPASQDEQEAVGLSLDEMDLNLAYGGLSYTDEAEAFGDADLLDEATVEDAAADVEAEDESEVIADVPELRNARDDDLVRTYVRIVWGNLDGERELDASVSLDPSLFLTWDGSLTVTEGSAIALKKTILFERPLDHLFPRVDRQSLAWHSTTLPHVDGLLVCVVTRLDENGDLRGELTFDTPLLKQSFALADLATLDLTVGVDDLGNGVNFLGFTERPDDVCPHGFLGGVWRNIADANGGGFAGRMVGANGRMIGFLKGRYGVNEEGQRVFAGKVIGRGGRIKGLMQGVWEPSSEHDGLGSFVGRWAGRNGEHKGTLKGRYQSHPERPGGTFHGVWEENCDSGDEDEA